MSVTPPCLLPDVSGRKCCQCGAPADVKNGHSYYCARHRRFQQMLCTARYDGKLVPPAGWMEANVPEDMGCPVCKRTMNWLARDGWSTTISLQHDRDGSMRFLCYGCNVKHHYLPGDSFYALPEGHKRCPICTEIKPLGDFSSTNVACRPCCRSTANARRAADPEAANAKARAYRAAHREERNAKNNTWRKENLEAQKARVRAWRQANIEVQRARAREWRQANRDAVNARVRERTALKKLKRNSDAEK